MAHSAVLATFAIFFTFLDSVLAGESGALCSDGVIPATIPCEQDCQSQHNSSTGTCTTDGNYNCICSGPGIPVESCIYPGIILGIVVNVPLICQCGHNNTALQRTSYNHVCDTDCKCNHGAASGVCDWNYKQCICDWPTGFDWNEERAVCVIEGLYDVTTCVVGLALTGSLPAGC